MTGDMWRDCVRALVALVVLLISPIAAPQVPAAAGTRRNGASRSCGTVDELSPGYLPLYELNLSGKVYWPDDGAIGELGVRLGQDLIGHSGFPVAILNGAHGGQPSTFFKRSPTGPSASAMNYGWLLQRVTAAGLKDELRAVVWYQGEADTGMSGRPTAAQHNANVRALMTSWRTDFTHLEHIYVVQIRQHCGALHSAAVQEVQRRFAGIPGT